MIIELTNEQAQLLKVVLEARLNHIVETPDAELFNGEEDVVEGVLDQLVEEGT